METRVWYAPHKFQAYGQEEIDAVVECLQAGWLSPGPRTDQFERVVSASFGKKFGVFVNSGSSANTLALLIAGVGPGAEVVTPACTFSTVVAPIVQLGATPVFVDVMPGHFVPSADAVCEALTHRTKAVFLPNLAGQKPDWATLRERIAARSPKIWLIEDSCDTMTCTEESDVSVVSFYASHVMTAGGCGGMVMCNDESQRAVALKYRDWGRVGNNSEDMSERFGHDVDGIEYDFKFLYDVVGYNFKCCEMNAAFGLAQFKKLPIFKSRRRANVERYFERLVDSQFLLPDDSSKEDWLALPLLVTNRKSVLQHLESNGIQTRVFFAGNITRHPAYRQFFNVYPESDRVMREAFMVGCHHGMSQSDVDYVCDVLLSAPRS